MADGKVYRASLARDMSLSIQGYMEKVDFLVAPISHDVILGKPWLDAQNPEIDWPTNRLTFKDQHGREHVWVKRDDITGDLYMDIDQEDQEMSATQLKERLREL